MTAVPAKPFLLNDATVSIDGDTYEEACKTVRFDPTTPVVKWKGLTPASRHQFVGTPEWDVTVAFAQDVQSASSLTRRLHTAAGETVEMIFAPKGGGVAITANVTLVPGALGGDLDTVPEASVTMPSSHPTIAAPGA